MRTTPGCWPFSSTASRKAALGKLLQPLTQSVLTVGYVEEGGNKLYAQAFALELKGVVAKDLESPYIPGTRSEVWLKIKRPGAVPAERFKFSKRQRIRTMTTIDASAPKLPPDNHSSPVRVP